MTVRSVRRGAAGYPGLLAQIPDPPPRLWVRGDEPLDVLERPAVAIVGARACSGYGRSVARLLATEAAAAGAVVVSGMARGIDGEAHRGALAAGGATVAVLGCGIDRDYPAAHAELARAILAGGGLVLSEYEQGVEPAPWRFPARKRRGLDGMRVWLNHAVRRRRIRRLRRAGEVPVRSGIRCPTGLDSGPSGGAALRPGTAGVPPGARPPPRPWVSTRGRAREGRRIRSTAVQSAMPACVMASRSDRFAVCPM